MRPRCHCFTSTHRRRELAAAPLRDVSAADLASTVIKETLGPVRC